MTNSNKIMLVVCSGILSFIYGMATVAYQIFPFEQVRDIKQILVPKPKPKPKLTYSNYFYHKKSFFEQHGRNNYDVVFIGDSITDGAEWEDLFPSIKIANRGIDGDRTDGILKRLDSIYSTSAHSAFIMVGVNDFSHEVSVDEVFYNYTNIVNHLIEKGMKVYIQSTILTGKQFDQQNWNKKIIELNNKLKLLANRHNSVTYIDLNSGLTKNNFLNPMYSRDGVHLNADGYAVWRDIIIPYIKNKKS